MTTASVVFEEVSWSPGGKLVLHQISAAFRPGTITAILGPNGAGKSSLLRAAAGFLPLTQGRVLWKGTTQNHFTSRQAALFRHWCGSQDESGLSASSVVEAGAYPLSGHWPKLSLPQLSRRQELQEALELKIDWNDHRPFQSFSSGERRLVHLIRTFLLPAEVYLLDEPGAPLDLRHRLLLGKLLRQCADQGATLLVSYHDLAEALAIADEVLILEGGALKAHGPVTVLTPELIEHVWGVQSPEKGWVWGSLGEKR